MSNDKVDKVAQDVMDAFRNGKVGSPLANVFLTLKSGRHSAEWSFRNQFLMMLRGYSDAMGYGQWRKLERQVMKGQKSFQILAPIIKGGKKNKETGKTEEGRCCGWRAVNVFGLEQTDGKPIEKDGALENWIEKLPLFEVAKSWGISIGGSHNPRALGTCSLDGKRIGLAVENLATWAHEMIHAADIKLGSLTEKGQHWRSETVAELGGAILLECLGYENDSDRGGAFKYIQRYAQETNMKVQDACMAVLNRTLKAVNLLLEAAEKLETEAAVAA